MHAYDGSLTEDDYVEILKLQRQLTPAVTPLAEWVLWFGLALSVMAAWAFFGNRQSPVEAFFWAALALPCFLFWWFRRPDPRRLWRSTPPEHLRCTGRVTDVALEARLAGTDARIPWQAFASRATSSRAIVLLAGRMVVPITRTLFPTEQDWLAACAAVEKGIPVRPGQGAAGGRAIARSVALWLVLLLVIFLAWHFAQLPKAR
jgi:hypothetical protein